MYENVQYALKRALVEIDNIEVSRSAQCKHKNMLISTIFKTVVFGLGAVLAVPRGHPAQWLIARGVLAEL